MKTTNLLHFPARTAFVPLRAFDVTRGEGRTMAVLFSVLLYRGQHPTGSNDQDCGNQQADHAVAEVDA